MTTTAAPVTAPLPAIEPEDYRRLVAFKLLLLAILGAAAYLNSVYGAFLFEDESAVYRAASGKAWFSPTGVADASLALNFAIGGVNPLSYHILNIALHVLAALALYGVVCRTLIRLHDRPRLQEAAPWLAFLIALLWMVHPLNTETVDYISRRGELLAGLCYLVTLYCVMRGATGERGLLWYALAVLACFLGMGSALTAVTAPLVVLLYDRIFLAESWGDLCRRRAGLYAGFVGCWVLFAASVLLVGYDPRAVSFAIPGVPPLAYALAQPGVILHDLGLAFWPLGICFDYSDWPLNEPAGSYVLPFLAVGVLLAATVWALLRRPKIGFLGAWFFLTLVPTSSFIPHAEAAGDYRMYLPLAAVVVAVVLAGFALVVWAGERAPWAVYAGAALALLAVGALGYATFRRNADYENPLTILEDAVAKRPGNVRAQYLLGSLYYLLGDPNRQAFGDLARLKEDRAKSNQYLDKAAAAFQAALKAPDAGRNAGYRAQAEHGLFQVLFLSNRADELLQLVAEAPEGAPERARKLYDIGFSFWADGRPDASANAAKFFAEAVRLQPDTAKYHFSLAVALTDKGDKEGAEAERKKGLQLDPDWPKTARQQAWEKATTADAQQRNPLQAIFLARQACQNDNQLAEAWDALAAAYAAAGRFKDATESAERARQLAEEQHNDALAREIQQRLSLYKEQKPFVQNQTGH